MRGRVLGIVISAVLLVLGGRSPAAAQEECSDLSTQLLSQFLASFPCPDTAQQLAAYEVKFLVKLNFLKAAVKGMNRSMRRALNARTITAQLTDYLAQCKAGLNNPAVRDPLSGPVGSLATVCAVTSAIQAGEMLIKSEASDHINDADRRTTGYTVVCGSVCPKNLRKTDFFYADGSYAGSVGYYGVFSGNGKPRLYGAAGGAEQHFAAEIAARAATIGNGMLYLQTSAATTGPSTACKEFAPIGRNGSL